MAWSILGAAGGISLLYAPFVYEVRGPSLSNYFACEGPIPLSRSGSLYTSVRVYSFGQLLCEEEQIDLWDVEQAVDRWYWLVAGTLAGAGGLGGLTIGWRERRRAPRKLSCWLGRRLGVVVAAAVFVLLADWSSWRERLNTVVLAKGLVLERNSRLAGSGCGMIGLADCVAVVSRALAFCPSRLVGPLGAGGYPWCSSAQRCVRSILWMILN